MPTIDFHDVPDAHDFSPVPDGEYLCRVEDAEETLTRSGDPMWRVRFSIELKSTCRLPNSVWSITLWTVVGKPLPKFSTCSLKRR